MKAIFKKVVVSILTWQSKVVLKKYKPKIIGVTGSVGKTSTKDAIHSALKSKFDIRKNQKSFNSEIGTPLTILNLENAWSNPLLWIKNIIKGFVLIIFNHPYPEWLVLEIGADRPGDIANIAKWVPCNVVVITRIPDVPVHVEYFDSPAAVIAEKKQLVKALTPDGVLILNADDDNVMTAKEGVTQKVITFGITAPADIQARDLKVKYNEQDGRSIASGMTFDILDGKNETPIDIDGALGVQCVYPALVAIAVGMSQKVPLKVLSEGLRAHTPSPGRMRIIEGAEHSTIIDDTYNASPVAMSQAVTTLGTIKTSGRKIAVLGDMMEIGKFSVAEHTKMGDVVAANAHMLVTVGVRAQDILAGAIAVGFHDENTMHFKDSASAGMWLKKIVGTGDVVLVKGSQSMRMEKVVVEIMASPQEKEKLLVRQDKAWKKR